MEKEYKEVICNKCNQPAFKAINQKYNPYMFLTPDNFLHLDNTPFTYKCKLICESCNTLGNSIELAKDKFLYFNALKGNERYVK